MLLPHSDIVLPPQPMEVAQVEPASTIENQQVEEPQSMKFIWTIENFSRINSKKQYSDIFVVVGYKWRVLIFPKGNNVHHLLMYLRSLLHCHMVGVDMLSLAWLWLIMSIRNIR